MTKPNCTDFINAKINELNKMAKKMEHFNKVLNNLNTMGINITKNYRMAKSGNFIGEFGLKNDISNIPNIKFLKPIVKRILKGVSNISGIIVTKVNYRYNDGVYVDFIIPTI